MDKKTLRALRRRLVRIDATMAGARWMPGADGPEAVAEWSRAQDAMGHAERAIETDDERGATLSMDSARDAMRRHASIVRRVLAIEGGVR